MWIAWLVISGIFIIIEIVTIGFLMFWFAVGALFAMVTSFFTDNIFIQTAVFVVVSTILLFFTRPFANKVTKKSKSVSTNAYSIIGKHGIVLKDIDPSSSTGQIKIGSEVWSAISLNKIKIPKDTEIEVVEIDGVKAIVK